MRISDWSSDVCSSDLERRLAAELEPQQLQIVGGAAEDVLARTHAAGERDEPRDRMPDQRGAQALAGAAHHVDDAGGEIELGRELGNLQRRDRRALMALEDRKSVGEGEGGYVRVCLGGRRILKKKK